MPETVVHFQIRMPPQMHEKMASRARDSKLSLNALIVGILSEAIERAEAAAEEEESTEPTGAPASRSGRVARTS
jgi:hypothetical protein